MTLKTCRQRTAAAYVVVSNHQSNLDPMVHLQALPLSLRVLAKREMFQILLLGPAMRTAGMIEVDRDSPDFRRIDQAAARSLAAGHSLLVYPEGTTSPDGTIGDFKDGAFIIAVTSQVPIVPVTIHGTCRTGRRANPRRPRAHRCRKPPADQRPDPPRHCQTA